MTESQPQDIRRAVRERYAAVAAGQSSCCGPAAETASPCCAPSQGAKHATSRKMGYGEADFAAAPEEAIMGLGCGNPTATAALRPGETVLDLGSGGGFDCFLAAREVGPEGRVIGVDMTPEMVERARRNAEKLESRRSGRHRAPSAGVAKPCRCAGIARGSAPTRRNAVTISMGHY